MPIRAMLAAATLPAFIAVAQPPASPVSGPTVAAPAPQPPIIVDLYSPGVVLVTAEHTSHQGPVKRPGVGFFIGPGRLVTTRSLLFGATAATLTMDNGRSLPITRIVADDAAADLVIASAEVPSDLLRGLAISATPPIPGEDVAIIGAPKAPGGEDGRPPEHDIAVAVVGQKAESSYKLTGDVSLRLAGAPALNVTGQVVAVVFSRPGDGGVTLALPATRVQDMVVTSGLPLDEWAKGTPLPRPAAPDEPPPPAKVVIRDDGAMLLDDRFTVTGKGTAEEPYKVSWDLLISASEEFVPKQGRKNIPERISMFAGKHVELTGHVAFPLMAEAAEECLSMMNPWDGCCIGVPPTPYDAVEVQLAVPVTGQARFTTYGSIVGKLRVEPQLVGSWLVGLYVIDAAKLTPKAFGGFAP